MEYRQLRSFVAVATAGSLNSASKSLYLSQSALSYQIRSLEDQLRVRLFQRRPRGVELTPAGQAILPLARELLDQTDQASRLFKEPPLQQGGTINLGITPTPARLFVPDLLVASVLEEGLQINVRQGFSGGHYQSLIDGRLDIAVCYSSPHLPRLDGYPLYEDDIFLVGPPDVVVTALGDLPFDQIADYQLVLTDTAHLARRRVENLARERGLRLNVAHEIDMIDVQRQLVIGHRRCTLASWGLFLDELRTGRLGGRRIAGPVLSRTMSIFARHGIDTFSHSYVATKLQQAVRSRVELQRSDFWWLRLPERRDHAEEA